MRDERIDDGGPAFPGGIDHGVAGIESYTGMTLRDWFAGQALAGLVARCGVDLDMETVATAYDVAERMIEMGKR